MDEGERERLERDVHGLCDAGDYVSAATLALRGYGPELYSFLLALNESEIDAADAFAELIQTPGNPIPHGERVIWELEQDGQWITDQPMVAVAIVKWLAERGSFQPWTADEATKLLEKALVAGAAKPDVIAAADVLAGLPCQAAIDLVVRLQRGDPGADTQKEKE